MSNKLFSVAVVTITVAAASLLAVTPSHSQNSTSVGGQSTSLGASGTPGSNGTLSNSSSTGSATGSNTGATSGSNSSANPNGTFSGTAANVSATGVFSSGGANTGVAVNPTSGSGTASASAGSNGFGSSNANSNSGAIAVPGGGTSAGGFGNFGSFGSK